VAGLDPKDFKLTFPLASVPAINLATAKPKTNGIVQRRIYYLRYQCDECKGLHSIRAERQVYKNGELLWETNGFHMKKVKARTPEELLQKSGIRFRGKVRLVKE